MQYLSKYSRLPSRNPKTETPEQKTGVVSIRCWLGWVYIYCIWVNMGLCVYKMVELINYSHQYYIYTRKVEAKRSTSEV
jgi:hypothetical protein